MFPKLNLCTSHLDTNSRLMQIVIMIYVYVIINYKLALVKNVLVSQLVILWCDAHIDHLIKKCNSYLFLLPWMKVFLSRRKRILFYNSYSLHHIDWCCIILGNYSSTLEDKLVKFQKRPARIILDCDYYYLKNSIDKHSMKELHIKKQF